MKKALATIVVVGALAAACGSDDETEDALSAVCDAQVQVLQDVAALSTVDPATTTGDDFKAQVESLQSSVDDLQAAKGDLEEQDVDNVTSAFEALQSDLQDLGDVTLEELDEATVTTIGTAIEDFQAAYAEAYANSSCTPDTEE